MAVQHLKWLDLLVIAFGFLAMIYIGVHSAKKTKSSEDFFMAGRNMPGWIVGLSILATMISSIGFLAVPGFSFEHNWRFLAQYASFVVPLFIAIFFVIPFFRKNRFYTPFEYLERRFGTWARLYAAGIAVVGGVFFIGNVIYTISLPIRVATGWSVPAIIIGFAMIALAYTIAGGLRAVIWTDLIQAIALFIGGLLIVPIICLRLPGGFMQIVRQAYTDGKMSMGTMAFTFSERGFWVIFLGGMLAFMVLYTTDQNYIQRYNAPRNIKESYKAAIIGAVTYFPVMFYFLFVGTSLYVFYKQFPSETVTGLDAAEVLPYFIMSEIPMGISGLIMVGLLAAALSTLDSCINAFASVLNNDFYRRLIAKDNSERHYLTSGRWISLGLTVLMVLVAILIHLWRTGALLDLFFFFGLIQRAGLFGLFLVGFVTNRVNNRMAIVGIVCTLVFVVVFLIVSSEVLGGAYWAQLRQKLPDVFWLGPLSDALMILIAYGGGILFGQRSQKELRNLTIWTMDSNWRQEAQVKSD